MICSTEPFNYHSKRLFPLLLLYLFFTNSQVNKSTVIVVCGYFETRLQLGFH